MRTPWKVLSFMLIVGCDSKLFDEEGKEEESGVAGGDGDWSGDGGSGGGAVDGDIFGTTGGSGGGRARPCATTS